MRLHLIIQRHGLPTTRILWTTDSSGSGDVVGVGVVTSSALTSTRTPNSAYGHQGYTVAQLLEDVNQVIPLETDSNVAAGEDDSLGGQWGLEDYVVEVGGFECLHFMNVEGLLREEDHVVIRALQKADLRARRVSGRLQISSDGKHLLDGIPFGRPFLKRSFSSRPAIRIPSRKRRRISFSSWDETFHQAGDDEEDADWPMEASTASASGRKLIELDSSRDSSDQESVVRIQPDTHEDEESGVEQDPSNFEPEDLTEELKDLLEDIGQTEWRQVSASRGSRLTQKSSPVSRRGKRPTKDRNSPPQSPISQRLSVNGQIPLSPRSRKNVRFEGDLLNGEHTSSVSPAGPAAGEERSDSEVELPDDDWNSDHGSLSDSDSDVSSYSDSDSEVDSDLSEVSSSADNVASGDTAIVHDQSSEPLPQQKVSAPGQGSRQTKNSNRRTKLRRRLKKLKELGVLPSEADFNDLRAWEEVHGRGGPLHELTDPAETRLSQSKERSEIEARRQKLLRDIEAGGIDVEVHSEKENFPPNNQQKEKLAQNHEIASPNNTASMAIPIQTAETVEDHSYKDSTELSKRRKLDVAGTKRLLFGSLGVKTPKTKQDEEDTRKKLAGKIKPQFGPSSRDDVEEGVMIESQDAESETNWEDKIIVRATECVYEDIEISAPPFPFVQRWDANAYALIRQRKRSDRNRIHENKHTYSTKVQDEDVVLNYDDPSVDGIGTAVDQVYTEEDLPGLPSDLSKVQNLECRDVVPGDIIAFKELAMGRETAWCPVISDYRVAEVIQAINESTLKVRLAKRHRRKNGGEGDAMEASGFDAPWLEEEKSGDDGFRDILLIDLIEPKLLRKSERKSQTNSKDHGQSASLVADNFPVPNITLEIPVQVHTTHSGMSPEFQTEISGFFPNAGFDSTIDPNLISLRNLSGVTKSLNSPQERTVDKGISPQMISPILYGWPSHLDSSAGERSSEGSLFNVTSMLAQEGGNYTQDNHSTSKSLTPYRVRPTQTQLETGRVQYPDLALSRETSIENYSFALHRSQIDMFDNSMLVDGLENTDLKDNGDDELFRPTTKTRPSRSGSSISSELSELLSESEHGREEDIAHPRSDRGSPRILGDSLVDEDKPFVTQEREFHSTAPIQATSQPARNAEASGPKTRRKATISSIQHPSLPVGTNGSASTPSMVTRNSLRKAKSSGPSQLDVVIDLTASSPITSCPSGDGDLPRGPGWVSKHGLSQGRTRTRPSAGRLPDKEPSENGTSPLNRPRTRSQGLDSGDQ